jgi:outer membrane protein assembly factor BamA
MAWRATATAWACGSTPIQLDYAWTLRTNEYNKDNGRFNFSIGYTY